jgi:hypothetical protein
MPPPPKPKPVTKQSWWLGTSQAGFTAKCVKEFAAQESKQPIAIQLWPHQRLIGSV